MDTIPVSEASLGLHTHRSAAKALKVTERQLGKWLKTGRAPAKYRDTFIDLETAAILPLDELPSERVVGHTAWLSWDLLRSNEPEIAEALSSKGMRTNSTDWQSGKATQQSQLQGDYVRLVHGFAWARSDHRATTECGLPALYQLHLDVAFRLEHKKASPSERAAAEFLHAQTLGGALAYLAGRLGLDWFARPGSSSYRTDPENLKKVAQRLLSRIERYKWEERGLSRGHVSTHVAYNVAQIAALAQAPSVFARCLVALHDRHAKRFDIVLALFENDGDTKPMLAVPEIVSLIVQLKSGAVAH